jgi:glycerol kinase
VTETTALGAAYLAGLAVGFWQSPDELTAQWHEERRFEPTLSADARQAALARWRKAVNRAKAWEAP